MCQSCDRDAATMTASFSDGTALTVCSTCAVTARVMGAVLEAARQSVA
jgi:protein-arginine kinase activator protein McsA